ncbi:MAG: hypothetical protein H0T65_24050 [Deltaproteobacteria bacterium]|nr:hypothetical protein [Deltaproteobacteria bacterium]
MRPGRAQPLAIVEETTAIVAFASAPPIEEETTTKEDIVEHIDPEVTYAIERMSCEQTIIDVLVTPPHYGETIEAAYRRKERELTELFANLGRGEAAVLLKRLSDPRTDDALATRFARLVVDRRTRLLALLADAPRREARRR